MWTRLNERKPNINGNYLCMCNSCGNPYMCVMRYIKSGTLIERAAVPYLLNDDVWTVVNGTTKRMNNFITHWMELPNIPE